MRPGTPLRYVLLLSLLLAAVATAGAHAAGFEVQADTLSATAVGQTTFQSFTLQSTYINVPLIFALPTTQGGQQCAIRIRNVTTTSFEAACVEAPNRNGPHAAMTFQYIAVEPGTHELPLQGGGTLLVEANFVDTTTVQHNCAAGCGTTGWDTVNFSGLFSSSLTSAPAVVAQIQGMANESALVPGAASTPFLTEAIDNISTTGFDVALDRHEVSLGSVTSNERIGWLAMEPLGCQTLDVGGGSTIDFEAHLTGDVVDGWQNGCNANEGAVLACTYTSGPLAMASLAERDEVDGGWLRRCSTGSTTDVRLTIDEDNFRDGERNHIDEAVSVLAFEDEINITVATQATIASLRAHSASAGLAVEWSTSSEVGSTGFQLWRRSDDGWVAAAPRLDAFPPAPGGAVYRVLDRGAPAGDTAVYMIEETEFDGKVRRYGPYRVEIDAGRQPSRFVEGRTVRVQEPRAGSNVRAAFAPQARATATLAQSVADPTPHVKVGVEEDGLYSLTAEELASASGYSVTRVERWIRTRRVALSRDGVSVAWRPHDGGRALLFYGEATESLFSTANVYRVRLGRAGSLVTTVRTRPGAGTTQQTFATRSDFEVDAFPATAVPLDTQRDYWFWKGVAAGNATFGTQTFDFDLAELATGGGALELRLQGASTTLLATGHRAQVELNGQLLGDVTWAGLESTVGVLDIPAGLLRATGNELRVTGQLEPGAIQSLFYVNGFAIRHPRHYQTTNGELAFRGRRRAGLRVSHFNSPSVQVWEVSSPRRPRFVRGTRVVASGAGYELQMQALRTGDRYLAVEASQLRSPAFVQRVQALPEAARSDGAQYVLLTSPALAAAAQELATYRETTGLSTVVVTYEQLVDRFAASQPTPEAVRTFLRWASENWRETPQYLVLVGDGHFDYRNLTTAETNHVPPFLVTTSRGIFSADNTYGDLVGADGAPEVAVGRLPLRNAGELQALVDKMATYEFDGGAWTGQAVLVADDADSGGNFPGMAERILDTTPLGVETQALSIGELGGPEVRSQLFDRLGEGLSWLTYVGHGGLDRLADEGVVLSGDGESWSGAAGLPVLLGLTCGINRFELPGFDALGGDLLRATGGTLATWAPSAPARAPHSVPLGEHLFAGWNPSSGARLGDLVRHSLQVSNGESTTDEVRQIFTLLGDPGLLVPEPRP